MKRVIIARSENVPSEGVLGPYRRYYRLLTDKDLVENGWSWKDFDDTYSMREYGIAYLGTAIIDSSKVEPSVYSTLTDAGYEILSIGKDASTGEVGLYLVSNAGFRPELIPFEDIEYAGEYEGYVEDVYY